MSGNRLKYFGREITDRLSALFTLGAHGYRRRTGDTTITMRTGADVYGGSAAAGARMVDGSVPPMPAHPPRPFHPPMPVYPPPGSFSPHAPAYSAGPSIPTASSGTPGTAAQSSISGVERRDGAPRDAARAAPLTAAEKRSVYRYTEWDFVWLNRKLRAGRELTPTEQRIHSEVRDALAKLPDFRGPVIRRANVDEADLARYQVGAETTELSYTSTTKNPDADFEGMDGQVEWQIESKTGKNISSYSHRPGEEEVLFRDNTTFRVTERFTDSATGRLVIRMEEIVA
ncbi:ADP-ribosyltransferase [Nocardia sp. NPDC002869]|uniref:ADP-ribosyltransferase n=1 Tax=Nocardia sp. NPDC002869 TaxID=3161032 RepID=UPI00398CEABE